MASTPRAPGGGGPPTADRSLDRDALRARAHEVAHREQKARRLRLEHHLETLAFHLQLTGMIADLHHGSELAQAIFAEQQADDEVATQRSGVREALVVTVGTTVFFGVIIGVGGWSSGRAGVTILLATLGVAVGSVADLWTQRGTLRRRVLALVDARQRVDELLRSEMSTIAFHLHRFDPREPAGDLVEIGRAGAFATRVAEADEVLEIAAMRVVRAHLARRGGAVLGIGGERGSGKSELIRAICRSSAGEGEQPVVGAFVAAPTAPDVEAFVRLVVMEVCEAVPGFASHEHRLAVIRQRTVRASALAAGVALVAVGALRVRRGSWPSIPWSGVLGWVGLVGGATLALTALLVILDVGAFVRVALRVGHGIRSRRRDRREAARAEAESGVPVPTPPRTLRAHRRIGEAVALERARARARREARRLHHEVRHIETLTTTRELGLSGRGGTLGIGSSRSLAALPHTSADLVGRLEDLVGTLRLATFRVVIGLDELDRLEAGEETDRFLNGIKQLFTIDGCSYLVSLSDSARAQFSRHGVDVIGVLDSSFDDTVVVEAFDHHAARHLLRRRGEIKMTDTQVLLCLALSGGRPRELLRQSRALAATKRTATTTSTTAAAADDLVESLWSRHRDDAVDRVTSWDRCPSRSSLLLALDQLDLDGGTTLALPPVHPRWPDGDEARMLVEELAAHAQVLATIGGVFGTTGGRAARVPPVQVGNALSGVLRAVDEDPVAGLHQLEAVRADLDRRGVPFRPSVGSARG